MKKLPRFLAVFLAVCLSLPNPAWALRVQSPRNNSQEPALLAGLEEQAWPADFVAYQKQLAAKINGSPKKWFRVEQSKNGLLTGLRSQNGNLFSVVPKDWSEYGLIAYSDVTGSVVLFHAPTGRINLFTSSREALRFQRGRSSRSYVKKEASRFLKAIAESGGVSTFSFAEGYKEHVKEGSNERYWPGTAYFELHNGSGIAVKVSSDQWTLVQRHPGFQKTAKSVPGTRRSGTDTAGLEEDAKGRPEAQSSLERYKTEFIPGTEWSVFVKGVHPSGAGVIVLFETSDRTDFQGFIPKSQASSFKDNLYKMERRRFRALLQTAEFDSVKNRWRLVFYLLDGAARARREHFLNQFQVGQELTSDIDRANRHGMWGTYRRTRVFIPRSTTPKEMQQVDFSFWPGRRVVGKIIEIRPLEEDLTLSFVRLVDQPNITELLAPVVPGPVIQTTPSGLEELALVDREV